MISRFLFEIVRVRDSLIHDSPFEIHGILATKGVGNSQAVSNLPPIHVVTLEELG